MSLPPGMNCLQPSDHNADKVGAHLASWRVILARSGNREATQREWLDFLAEHGSHMQPPDGEG